MCVCFVFLIIFFICVTYSFRPIINSKCLPGKNVLPLLEFLEEEKPLSHKYFIQIFLAFANLKSITYLNLQPKLGCAHLQHDWWPSLHETQFVCFLRNTQAADRESVRKYRYILMQFTGCWQGSTHRLSALSPLRLWGWLHPWLLHTVSVTKSKLTFSKKNLFTLSDNWEHVSRSKSKNMS